jgi:peptide/nickel transport system permease protein
MANAEIASEVLLSETKSEKSKIWARLIRNPSGLVGMTIIGVLVIVAVIGPYLVNVNPNEPHLAMRLNPPSKEHPFGTDQLGRDVFARVVYGARISVQVGALVLFVAVTIGVALGALAGYYGGWIDECIMRVTDIFLSFPSTVLAMAVSAVLGRGIYNAMLAVGLVWWPWYARLIRGQILSLKQADFVKAAESLGFTKFRILWHHVLPNTIGTIIVQASLDVGYAILTTAGLSFIGLGAQPPQAEWGAMVAEGRQYLTTSWWVPMLPGLAIFLTVMGVNLFGDALRDAMDPRHTSK